MFDFLRKSSDTSVYDANANYSSTAARFILLPQPLVIVVVGLIVSIGDTDNSSAKYGDIAALTNGVQFRVEKFDGTTFTANPDNKLKIPMKANRDYYSLAAKQSGFDYLQESDLTVIAKHRIDFLELDGPIQVNPGEVFVKYLNDDLSGLTLHRTLVIFRNKD